MTSIKGPSKTGSSGITSASGDPAGAVSAAPSTTIQTEITKGTHREQPTSDLYSPEIMAKLENIRKTPINATIVGGAAGLFTDGVFFPPNLLDTNDSTNDVYYLRLLAAVLGMQEYERYYRVKQGLPETDEEDWGDEQGDGPDPDEDQEPDE